jgi:MFS transporter, DHA1 family, multidrug resistance protein
VIIEVNVRNGLYPHSPLPLVLSSSTVVPAPDSSVGAAPEHWRRNGYVMAATVFAVFTGFAFVLPFLPLYVRELGVRDDESVVLWAGGLIGVAPLLAGAMAPVWGRLADRYGHKRMAIRALVAYVALLALSARAGSPLELLLLRAGVGLAGGIGPLSLAMASANAPREMTGRAVGMVQSAQILAAAAGPLIGGALADRIGIRATFVVTAAVCACALLLVILLYREGGAGGRHGGTSPALSLQGLLRMPSAAALLTLLFFANFVSRSFTPVLPLHLESLGVPTPRLASFTGVLISAYSVAAAFSAWAYGAMSRRHPPRTLLGLSLLGGCLSVAPMAFVPSFGVFLLLAVGFGLVSGGTLALGYTIGAQTVPEEQRGAAFGFLSGAALFGGAVAPSVAGVLAHWKLVGIYYLDALVYLLLLLGPLRRVSRSRVEPEAR